MTVSEYFSGLFNGIKSLLTGMSVTIKEFFTPKITQQYPENRATLTIPERVRGVLRMPHDENNEHACTACQICETNCPNGTIKITTQVVVTEDGKKKKELVDYYYELGRCTFCNLCVLTCPSDAIRFSNSFEEAVFSRAKLNEKLNKIGSKLREKKRPAIAPKPEVKQETTASAKLEKKEVVEKPVVTEEVKPIEGTNTEAVNNVSSSTPIKPTTDNNGTEAEDKK